MTNNEMVDKIVAKSGITREQAEEALAMHNGDLLDAMIYVERTYSQKNSAESSRYSTYTAQNPEPNVNTGANANANVGGTATQQDFSFNENKSTASFDTDKAVSVFKKLFHKGMNNSIVVSYNGKDVISLPVLVGVIILLSSVSTVLVVMLISMFFNVRYYFKGTDLGTPKINFVMNGIYEFVQRVKTSFMNS